MNDQTITLPTIIESREHLDNALAVLGELDALTLTADADQDQALAATRDLFAHRYTLPIGEPGEAGKPTAVPISEVRENLVGQIERWCEKNRKQLLVDDNKSLQLSHGVIGWRKAKDVVEELEQDEETKAKGLLQRCVTAVLNAAAALTMKLGKTPIASCLNITVSWKKAAVLGAFNDKHVTAAQLKKHGLQVVRGTDEFYCTPKSEKRAA